MTSPGMPALVVVDVQRGFDDESWGRRNNPDCEGNITRLLGRWRERSWPVVLVRHDSVLPGSPLAPGESGNAFKDGIDGPHDLLVAKSVNSAFYGTPDLHAWLQASGLDDLAICGITTDHCCETTARMAGNLGYRVRFAIDATHTFDRAGPDGEILPAEQISKVTAASLHGEFAEVVRTADLLAAQPAGRPIFPATGGGLGITPRARPGAGR